MQGNRVILLASPGVPSSEFQVPGLERNDHLLRPAGYAASLRALERFDSFGTTRAPCLGTWNLELGTLDEVGVRVELDRPEVP